MQSVNVDFNYFSTDHGAQCPAARALIATYAATQLTPDAKSIGLAVQSSYLAFLNCPGGQLFSHSCPAFLLLICSNSIGPASRAAELSSNSMAQVFALTTRVLTMTVTICLDIAKIRP